MSRDFPKLNVQESEKLASSSLRKNDTLVTYKRSSSEVDRILKHSEPALYSLHPQLVHVDAQVNSTQAEV